jgi:hypothetical protein
VNLKTVVQYHIVYDVEDSVARTLVKEAAHPKYCTSLMRHLLQSSTEREKTAVEFLVAKLTINNRSSMKK